MSVPFNDALEQCRSHAQRMSAALRRMPQPVTERDVATAGEDAITVMDQFAYRFTKLQDTIGAQLLRSFAAEVLAEPAEDMVFIDVLGLLERYGFLQQNDWQAQRDTRNALAHEYPNHPDRQAKALSQAQAKAPQLLDWLHGIERHISRHTP